jgi:hypothetical protein
LEEWRNAQALEPEVTLQRPKSFVKRFRLLLRQTGAPQVNEAYQASAAIEAVGGQPASSMNW